jgi:hypothetical protein
VTIALGLVCGLVVLVTGVINIVWPGYGQAFLDILASIYPGYEATGSLGGVIFATLYGFADGALIGLAYAWLYNRIAAH